LENDKWSEKTNHKGISNICDWLPLPLSGDFRKSQEVIQSVLFQTRSRDFTKTNEFCSPSCKNCSRPAAMPILPLR